MCQNIRSVLSQTDSSIAEVVSYMASSNLESQLEKGLEVSPSFPDHKCTSISLTSESVPLCARCMSNPIKFLHGLIRLSHVRLDNIASTAQVT